jgi:hypothetical protein
MNYITQDCLAKKWSVNCLPSKKSKLNLCLVVIVDLSLFLLEIFVIDSGLLVLLVLRHQVVHVGLGLSELHLIHTHASVPMEESLSSEHGSELF